MESPPSKEAVNHPAHYNSHPSGIEAIDLIEDLPFNLGNAIKYVFRRDHKGEDPVQELKKALWYTEREIQRRSKGRLYYAEYQRYVTDNLFPLFERVLQHETGNAYYAILALYNAACHPRWADRLHDAAKWISAEILLLQQKRVLLSEMPPPRAEDQVTRGQLTTTCTSDENPEWIPPREPVSLGAYSAGAPLVLDPPIKENPIPDASLASLQKLLSADRFQCRVCQKTPAVSRIPNGPFSVTCTTCVVGVSGDATGITFERWTTLLAKQNHKPIGAQVLAAQYREDPSTVSPPPPQPEPG